MRVLLFSICFFFVLVAGGSSLSVYAQSGTGTGMLTIDALVPGCGDGLITLPETCDGLNLGGNTCSDVGFGGGTLSCTLSCTYNTTLCTAPSSGGGGGSSSGGGSVIKKGAQVILTGNAYPRSTVTVLKDAQVIATTIAGSDARFEVGIQKLTPGTYIFSVYSEDEAGNRSSLLTFPVAVTKNILAKIESIFIAPTITSDKIQVRKGDPIVLFGTSVPSSEVTIEVNSPEQIFVKTRSNQTGAYVYNFDSSVLSMGDHHARSRSTRSELISSQGVSTEFTVGTTNVFRESQSACSHKADFNKDCRVNLVDFSIAAFWYQRPLSDTFLLREKEHVNGDGVINLVDFSIMAFYWTG
jgi:hypothetical protein